MKTVKTILLTFALACLGMAAFGQGREGFDKMEPHDRSELNKSVHLYPNPAIEYLSVKFDEPVARRTKYSVHNIIGSTMEVESELVDEFEVRFRVKDLPTGYYLIVLKDDTSNQRGTFKFLKR
jgi:hypothetical protein